MKAMTYIIRCLLLAVGCLLFAACTEAVSDAKQENALPRIYPDYLGVTIPVNIAPLNFGMTDEKALLVDAVVSDRHGHTLHSQGKESVDFDLDDWHTLLDQNRGDSLSVTVSAKYDDGWHTYTARRNGETAFIPRRSRLAWRARKARIRPPPPAPAAAF